jgi:hypothetical protein
MGIHNEQIVEEGQILATEGWILASYWLQAIQTGEVKAI